MATAAMVIVMAAYQVLGPMEATERAGIASRSLGEEGRIWISCSSGTGARCLHLLLFWADPGFRGVGHVWIGFGVQAVRMPRRRERQSPVSCRPWRRHERVPDRLPRNARSGPTHVGMDRTRMTLTVARGVGERRFLAGLGSGVDVDVASVDVPYRHRDLWGIGDLVVIRRSGRASPSGFPGFGSRGGRSRWG